MEDEPCRKKRLQVRFRRSKKKPTTPSANGRSGWSCVSVNWMPISRRSARQVLRALTNHLQSSAAIRRWIKEASNT
jgi:hypothetical protein